MSVSGLGLSTRAKKTRPSRRVLQFKHGVGSCPAQQDLMVVAVGAVDVAVGQFFF